MCLKLTSRHGSVLDPQDETAAVQEDSKMDTMRHLVAQLSMDLIGVNHKIMSGVTPM